ncbi:hypothetical protein HDU92_002422 [Lobulomyces angularis]|nr:hypothetical protein HDU92_002422 [Lobulomyces angularis]
MQETSPSSLQKPPFIIKKSKTKSPISNYIKKEKLFKLPTPKNNRLNKKLSISPGKLLLLPLPSSPNDFTKEKHTNYVKGGLADTLSKYIQREKSKTNIFKHDIKTEPSKLLNNGKIPLLKIKHITSTEIDNLILINSFENNECFFLKVNCFKIFDLKVNDVIKIFDKVEFRCFGDPLKVFYFASRFVKV